MATRTVHTLAYKMLFDGGQLKKGMTASRKEITAGKRAMREVRTPLEKLENDLEGLNEIYRKGVIDQETYRRKLNQLSEQFEKTASESSRLAKIQKGFGSAIFNVKNLMGVLAGAAVVRNVTNQIDKIDQLAKAAKNLGVSTEFLSRLDFAAGQSSGFVDGQAAKAMEKFTRRTSEAAAGTGEAKVVIEELGLSAQRLAAAGPERAFFAVKNAMSQVTSEHDRLRIATKLFDDEQAKIHLTLGQSNQALGEQFKRADKLGKTISSFDAAKMEAAKDAIGEMESSFGAFSRKFAVTIGPSLIQIVNELTSILDRLDSREPGDEPTVTDRATASDGFTAAIRTASQNFDINGENFLNPLKIFKNMDDVVRERVARETRSLALFQKQEREKRQAREIANRQLRRPAARQDNRTLNRIAISSERQAEINRRMLIQMQTQPRNQQVRLEK